MASVTIGDGGGGGVRDRGLGAASPLYLYLQIQWNPINIVTYWPKKLGRINRVTMLKRVFYMKMHGGFCEAPKKSGRNNEVAILPRWWKGGVSL